MIRLSRDAYYMKIAKIVAERSTCLRAKVGCILVDHYTGRIVATGYNGSPKGAPHCLDRGCIERELEKFHGKSCVRTVHAELNAIIHLDKNYDSLLLYSTHQPCFQCWKALVTANINQVFYLIPYKDEIREELNKERSLSMIQLII